MSARKRKPETRGGGGVDPKRRKCAAAAAAPPSSSSLSEEDSLAICLSDFFVTSCGGVSASAECLPRRPSTCVVRVWFHSQPPPLGVRLRVRVALFASDGNDKSMVDDDTCVVPGVVFFRCMPAGRLLTVRLFLHSASGLRCPSLHFSQQDCADGFDAFCFTTSTHDDRARVCLRMGDLDGVLWHGLRSHCASTRQLANLLRMTCKERLFHVRFVCTGLFPTRSTAASATALDSTDEDEDDNAEDDNESAAAAGSVAVATDTPGVRASDLSMPATYSLAVARTSARMLRSFRVVSHQFDSTMTTQLLDLLPLCLGATQQRKRLLMVSISVERPNGTLVHEASTTTDCLLRFARSVARRSFVSVVDDSGTETFVSVVTLKPSQTVVARRELTAFAIAVVLLFVHTGLGPRLKFSHALLAAFSGRDLAPPSQNFANAVVAEYYWTDVVSDAWLRRCVSDTFSQMLGSNVLAALPLGEFDALMSGETCP